MVKYVSEEVDRVRDLFQAKEQKLITERDEAKQVASRQEDECAALRSGMTDLKYSLDTHLEEAKVGCSCC